MRQQQGTRLELEGKLRDLVAGWEHFENDYQKEEAELALAEVQNGAREVIAGHTIYQVTNA